jgi:hypothetical protein
MKKNKEGYSNTQVRYKNQPLKKILNVHFGRGISMAL